MRPVAHLVFDGQSLWYASSNPAVRQVPLLLPGLSNAVTAIVGTTYAQRAPTYAQRVYSAVVNGNPAVLVDLAGQSDIATDVSAAALLATVEAQADATKANGFAAYVVCTVPPSTLYTAPQEAQRVLYNAALRESAHFDAVADIAAIPQLANPADTTYYSDGLHFTVAGVTLAAPVIAAAISAVL